MTELAIAFANDHLRNFSFIGWIDGSSEESLVYSDAKTGRSFRYSRRASHQAARKNHIGTLKTGKGNPGDDFDDGRNFLQICQSRVGLY